MTRPRLPSPASRRIKRATAAIVRAALTAVDPVRLISGRFRVRRERLQIGGKTFDLRKFRLLHVLAAGKAAPGMAAAVCAALGNRLAGGVVVAPAGGKRHMPPLHYFRAAHPLPDRSSLLAGRAVMDYVRCHVGPRDLVIALISGGASSLLAAPETGITLADKIRINRKLLRSGADIREINAVRQAMSALKGGKLARLIAPAALATLVLSDIPASPLAAVGSGPTVESGERPEAALRILKKYKIFQTLNPRLKRFFSIKNRAHSSPNPLAASSTSRLPSFAPSPFSYVFLLGSISTALKAARSKAGELGFNAHILTACECGDARQAAGRTGRLLRRIAARGEPFQPPVMLLAGGELTVKVRGRGKGGRNQEFILALLREWKDFQRPFFALSLGTDGRDGPTPAAGAWIDERSFAQAQELGLDVDHFLERNDSHHFFKKMDQLIVTGATGTNVADLRLFYVSG